MQSNSTSGSSSEDRLGLLLDTLVQGVQENDCDGTITYSNRSHHAILGYEPGELLGRKIWETLPSEEDKASFKVYFSALKNTQPAPVPFESANRRKDGSLIDVRVDWNYLRDDSGGLTGFISIITGLASLLEVSKRLVASLDLDKILQATVDSVANLANLDTAAIYLLEEDMLHLRATTPPLPPQFPDELRVAPLAEHHHIREAIESLEPVFLPDAMDADLTPAEKSVVEQRNLRSLLYLPLVAETEVMGALIVGSVGKPSPISRDDIDLSHTLGNVSALAVKNARLFRAGQKYAEELERTLAERKRSEEEREKLREQLLQAQKMDAVGKLAGGIAHDFNNQLSGVLGYAEILHDKLKDERQRRIASNIIKIAERSADLTAQLLAFSRKGPLQITAIDLHTIIKEVVSILRRTIDRRIVIRQQLEARSYTTQGDPSQIQSALLNLALNARDAMPEGGEMIFHTQTVGLEADYCKQHPFRLTPGKYVQLSVTDSGVGMDAATIGRIYEPFFTTKKPGEGTGLGLSAVYGTMKTHKGGISVYSEPGRGSTFKLLFPLEEPADLTAAKSVSPSNSEVDDLSFESRTAPKVLIVDDEEMVASVAAEHLRQAGYEVHVYTDSCAALSFFKENYRALSLVVLDMVMPEMDGREMFRSMKGIDPKVRVLLSSGFSLNGAAQTLLDGGALGFIQKPFRRNDLLSAVRRVLED